jgi:hypothetical protein
LFTETQNLEKLAALRSFSAVSSLNTQKDHTLLIYTAEKIFCQKNGHQAAAADDDDDEADWKFENTHFRKSNLTVSSAGDSRFCRISSQLPFGKLR